MFTDPSACPPKNSPFDLTSTIVQFFITLLLLFNKAKLYRVKEVHSDECYTRKKLRFFLVKNH